jgi:aryl-alcohol dehydrogenase-like predicted oxidoreductase
MLRHQSSGENNVINEVLYNPKSKDKKLRIYHKLIILIGSLFFVFLMVNYEHPNLLNKIINNNINNDNNIIKGYATLEGTHNFCQNFQKSYCSLTSVDLTLSTIGFGSYLGDVDDLSDGIVISAVIESITSGINVIDTSINYRGEKSERNIGIALYKLLISTDDVSRDQLFIATKSGFIPSDIVNNKNSQIIALEWKNKAKLNDIYNKNEIISGHCIHPDCLQISLDKSLENLRLDTIDLFYLHNIEKQLSLINLSDLIIRIENAFIYLEKQRQIGKIKFYGLATWSCFRVNKNHNLYISLSDVVDIAMKVGGDNHGFRFIELPLNPSIGEAQLELNQRGGLNIIQAANKHGINIIASRSIAAADIDSLFAIDRTVSQCNEEIVNNENKLIKSTPALALQLTRSLPGVSVALVGMKTSNHIKENSNILKLDKLNEDFTKCVFDKGTAIMKSKSNLGSTISKKKVVQPGVRSKSIEHRGKEHGTPNLRKKSQGKSSSGFKDVNSGAHKDKPLPSHKKERKRKDLD